jgi:CBS domain-containing protein
MSFGDPVTRYMTSEVEMVAVDASLDEIELLLDRCRIAAVPVVGNGALVGLVSRAELGGAGFARDVMRPAVECSPETTLRDAARLMLERRCHRVVVVRDGWPAGMLTVRDLTLAVRDERIGLPLREIMRSPVTTIPYDVSVTAAIDLLERAGLGALVVTDDGWPIGMLGHAEAVEARDRAPDARVDDAMDPAVICLPARTRVHHAAALASDLDVRAILVQIGHELRGIVAGLDFAKVVAA